MAHLKKKHCNGPSIQENRQLLYGCNTVNKTASERMPQQGAIDLREIVSKSYPHETGS